MRIDKDSWLDLQIATTSKQDRNAVFSSLDRLEASKVFIGKPLREPLQDCRAIRTGSYGQLRIVYQVMGSTARIIMIGPRDGSQVYLEAARLLGRSKL